MCAPCCFKNSLVLGFSVSFHNKLLLYTHTHTKWSENLLARDWKFRVEIRRVRSSIKGQRPQPPERTASKLQAGSISCVQWFKILHSFWNCRAVLELRLISILKNIHPENERGRISSTPVVMTQEESVCWQTRSRLPQHCSQRVSSWNGSRIVSRLIRNSFFSLRF